MKASQILLTLAAALSFTGASAATYTVKPGDTLYSIARAAGTDASTLMRLNGLTSTTIKVGAKLETGTKATVTTASKPVTAAKPAAVVTTAGTGNAYIRTAAARFLGIRYVLGGNGSNGIDCSSYTQAVFRSMGISLPRTAAAQWSTGRAVSRRDLRAGDLVFFNTTGRTASHVGIYMGGGMMANANSYIGRSMIEPLFSNAYWASRYQGARRVLN